MKFIIYYHVFFIYLSLLLFISYFQVHFCSIFFIYLLFCHFFFFCTSNETIMCLICMLLFFLVLSLLTPTSLWLILREERQDHPNCRENSSPFCLCCCVTTGLGLVNLLYFYPPSHPYYFMGHPTPKPTTFPGSSLNSSPKDTTGTSLPQVSRGSAIHVFLVYV